MVRDDAVARINDGLGFMPEGHPQTETIIKRLIEAQRDLEKGKTLPKFLLQEDQDLTLLANTHSVALPERFIRVDDDNLPHFFDSPSNIGPIFMKQMFYSDAVRWTSFSGGGVTMEKRGPRVFVIRKSTIDFIVTADRQYDMKWNYYKGAMTLETNVTNFWLDEVHGAPEWLIGEAGYRMAYDKRDDGAMKLFDDMRTRARSAQFADDLFEEVSGGPIVMGSAI